MIRPIVQPLAVVAVVTALCRPATAAELVHTVRPGESISSVARRYYGDFEHTDLILRHNGREKAMVRPGETLRVPYCRVHVVRAGDTWSEIAQRYLERASDYEVMARLNGLEPASPLSIGQRIVVPWSLSHELERGETLGSLAERFYADLGRAELLREFNRIEDPRRLPVGQRIRIPLVAPLLARKPGEAPSPEKPPAKPAADEASAGERPAGAARASRSRFAAPVSAARRAFHEGDYEGAIRVLKPLVGPIDREGDRKARAEYWTLVAFVHVAFDRTDQACAAYAAAPVRSPLDPDRISPKIIETLAGCEPAGGATAGG